MPLLVTLASVKGVPELIIAIAVPHWWKISTHAAVVAGLLEAHTWPQVCRSGDQMGLWP